MKTFMISFSFNFELEQVYCFIFYTLYIYFVFLHQLFHEKNYEPAAMCFERANDKYWERMAKASGLKAMADYMRNSKPDEANSALREAAEIFEAIGKAYFAARCFTDLGEYERAGMDSLTRI